MNANILCAICFIGALASSSLGQDRSRYSLATFVSEITPPIGHPLQAGLGVQPVARVDDPLYAHGFVMLGGELPIVLVSLDWCGIGNDAHDLWRSYLADAVGTKPERVLVCAIHQHDAPLADLEAERRIAKLKLDRSTLDLDWHERTVARVADALKRGLKDIKPVSHIGIGQAKVEKIASNRRIIGKDGTIEFWRGSAMTDPKAKEAPEGLVDPWLKTISFWNGETAIASLSVYATHPMSFYGKGNVSADFVGLARRRWQRDEPGAMHFFANGCGGNLAPGKYNRGEPEDREDLTERLYKAWKEAWENTKKLPIEQMVFRSIPFSLIPKTADNFATDKLEAILSNDQIRFDERVRAAYALSWSQRCATNRQLDLPVIDFGTAVITLLPGEPFVEYQLAAQRLRPESFVLTLGYGDYGPVYIPTDAAFSEGGYEVGDWSFVAEGVEKTLMAALRQGLIAEAMQREGRSEYRLKTAGAKRCHETPSARLGKLPRRNIWLRRDQAGDSDRRTRSWRYRACER